MRSTERLAGAALLALLTLPMAATTATPARAMEDVNRIILRVNDQIATLQDYQERKAARIDAIAQAQDLTTDERRKLAADAGKATLREMLDELLMMSRADQLKVNPSASEIDEAIDTQRQRFGLETEADFESALAQAGLTIAEFRARTAKNLAVQEVVQREVQNKVKVEPEEVQRYYRDHPEEFRLGERRKVREVVLRSDAAGSPAKATEHATALVAAARAGGDLAAAIAKLGADQSAASLIDHDWIERGTLDRPIEEAAWKLAAGGICDPVDGKGGAHVVQVLEIQPPSLRPYDEVKSAIESSERGKRFEDTMRKYMTDLEKHAFIVENLPAEAAGYREIATPENDPLKTLLDGPGAPAKPHDQPPVAPATPPADAPPSPPPTAGV